MNTTSFHSVFVFDLYLIQQILKANRSLHKYFEGSEGKKMHRQEKKQRSRMVSRALLLLLSMHFLSFTTFEVLMQASICFQDLLKYQLI
jgi:hypothetical protein